MPRDPSTPRRPAQRQRTARRPNVVVILCDQLRAFEVGAYGNTTVRTPHLDRLAADGVRFDLAFTNNPVCTPARSCLLSGQYSRTCTGELGNVADDPPSPVRLRLPDPTLAEALRAAGYRTGLIGKWHIDPHPELVGFDDAWFPLTVHRYQGQRYFDQNRLGPVLRGFAPERECERCDDWLAARDERPFFLFYNISLPHMPIGPHDMPARFARQYAPAEMPLRPNVWNQGRMAHDETWFKIYTIWDYFWRLWGPCWNAAPECGYPDRVGEQPYDRLPPGFNLRHLWALYYGAVSWTDALVGRFLASLARHGLAEDTIVVFTSDHGDSLGSHQRFNKDCLFEEAIRIPLLWRWPKGLQPRVNAAQPAQLIDIMPTVLDLCGIACPDTVQGASLAPVLRGTREALDACEVFIETDPSQDGCPCLGIRTPTHLYGVKLSADARAIAGPWGFYDLRTDPFQQHDLLAGGEQAELARQLHQRLVTWNGRTPWLDTQNRKD